MTRSSRPDFWILSTLIGLFSFYGYGYGQEDNRPKVDLEKVCGEPGESIPVESAGWPIATTGGDCDCTPTLIVSGSGARLSMGSGSGGACIGLSCTIPPETPPGTHRVEINYASGQPKANCIEVLLRVALGSQNPWEFGVATYPLTAKETARLVLRFNTERSCNAPLAKKILALQVMQWKAWDGAAYTNPVTPWSVNSEIWGHLNGLMSFEGWVHDFRYDETDPYRNGGRDEGDVRFCPGVTELPPGYKFRTDMTDPEWCIAGMLWEEWAEEGGVLKHCQATMDDKVTITDDDLGLGMIGGVKIWFETAVIIGEGPFAGKWLGTFKWTWERRLGGAAHIEIGSQSTGAPSQQFINAMIKSHADYWATELPQYVWPIPKGNPEGGKDCRRP